MREGHSHIASKQEQKRARLLCIRMCTVLVAMYQDVHCAGCYVSGCALCWC